MASENKKTYLPNVVTGASIRDGSGQIIDERFKKVEQNVEDLTKRVDDLDKYTKIEDVEDIYHLPSSSQAKENVIYVTKDSGMMYVWHNKPNDVGYHPYVNSMNFGGALSSDTWEDNK